MRKKGQKTLSVVMLLAIATGLPAQEVLAPLGSMNRTRAKGADTLVLELPFFDDFSDYEGAPDSKRWLTYDAFVNKDYAPLPPTVGMVTLDALDAQGNLYAQASTNIFSADTLASQIIRLDSLTGTYKRRLQPSDSVCLSFFYLPGGWYGNAWERVGEAPSTQDTLFLEFYSPDEDRWEVVWRTPGFTADTAGIDSQWPWRFAIVKIDDPKFFSKRFQFRFRNYASLDVNPKSGIAGNCDQWNIDYIYLNNNRNRGDSLYRDIAFVEKAPSMLKHYQSMPARQYRSSDMAESLEMVIVNRYNQTLSSNYAYTVYDNTGHSVANYNGGYENINAFYPFGRYQNMAVHSQPPVDFNYPADGQPTRYRVVHVVREGVGGDIHRNNDTIVFDQIFSNYYAYDDGVPENGYGLTAPGSRVWLAYRYDLNIGDTLTALDLYFNRTRNAENTGLQFQICIWNCVNGKPGALLYKDPVRQQPAFDGLNRFHRYTLDTPQLVSDSIFVGFEQITTIYANLGFDRNNDSRERLYYRTGDEWTQSILRGSVMMRPVFGSSGQLAVADTEGGNRLEAYPNPTTGTVHLRGGNGQTERLTLTLFDMKGHQVWQGAYSDTLHLEGLAGGLYLLRATDKSTGQQTIIKIIITH